MANLQAVYTTNNLDTVIALGYDGIVFDIEQSTEIIGIPDWNAAFEAVRAAGLIVMVTISHFLPYGLPNNAALVADWLQNPRIDVLSPQLYIKVRCVDRVPPTLSMLLL